MERLVPTSRKRAFYDTLSTPVVTGTALESGLVAIL